MDYADNNNVYFITAKGEVWVQQIAPTMGEALKMDGAKFPVSIASVKFINIEFKTIYITTTKGEIWTQSFGNYMLNEAVKFDAPLLGKVLKTAVKVKGGNPNILIIAGPKGEIYLYGLNNPDLGPVSLQSTDAENLKKEGKIKDYIIDIGTNQINDRSRVIIHKVNSKGAIWATNNTKVSADSYEIETAKFPATVKLLADPGTQLLSINWTTLILLDKKQQVWLFPLAYAE